MKTNSFTFQQLKEFILSQNDDRMIEMGECDNTPDLGCVLVHFGRKFAHRKVFQCGYTFVKFLNGSSFNCIRDDHFKVLTIITACMNMKVKTYAEVKKIVLQYDSI